MNDSAPKQEPPYGLRMPPDLKARVKAAAEANNRSMNAEIVATLEKAYPPLISLRPAINHALRKMIAAIEAVPGANISETNAQGIVSRIAASMGFPADIFTVERIEEWIEISCRPKEGGIYIMMTDTPAPPK